jgi:hypothetical protein
MLFGLSCLNGEKLRVGVHAISTRTFLGWINPNCSHDLFLFNPRCAWLAWSFPVYRYHSGVHHAFNQCQLGKRARIIQVSISLAPSESDHSVRQHGERRAPPGYEIVPP